MTKKWLRISGLALLAVLATAGFASAQTVAISLSGNGDGKANNGTGSGTLTPGGVAAASFTVADGRGDCSVLLNLTFKVTATTGDSLTVVFQTSAPNVSQTNPSATITGPLNVTGGTGAYAGKGGTGTGSLALTFTAKEDFTYTFTGSVTLGGPVLPTSGITPGGIVPVNGANSVIQPGEWVAIYGSNFVAATATWDGKFPTSLGGVSVTVNGKPGYLWFVSPGQINFQTPDDTKRGCVPVTVTTPNGTFTEQVDLESVAPAFSLLEFGDAAAVIPVPNGSGAYGSGANSYDLAGPVGRYSFKTRPVKRGESLVLYGVGFGPTNPPVPAGQAFSGSPQARTTNQIQISIGNQKTGQFIQLPVSFAGLVSAGLYQVNVTIPQNAPVGDLNVVANIGGGPGGGGGGGGGQVSQNLNVFLSVQ